MPAIKRIRILIPGQPVPKGRARAGKGGRHYTPTRTREYESRVATVSGIWVPEPLEGFVDVVIWLSFPFLKNGKERIRPGDLDNYAKSICDGMGQNSVCYHDDKQISHLSVFQCRGSLEGWAAVELCETNPFVEKPSWA